jgi:hypothetical protein
VAAGRSWLTCLQAKYKSINQYISKCTSLTQGSEYASREL